MFRNLQQVLMNHIRDKLPDMKARLNTLMGQTQQELNTFGDSTFLGEQHRVRYRLFVSQDEGLILNRQFSDPYRDPLS
jgi:hypothetical protein